MINKKYVVLITTTCSSERPTVRTRTYLIPTASNKTQAEIFYISNLEKIWTECINQKTDLSINNICKLILLNIPRDEVSKIVVESLGIGRAIYEGIRQIVQDEGLDIPVEEIYSPKHF